MGRRPSQSTRLYETDEERADQMARMKGPELLDREERTSAGSELVHS